MINIFWQFVAAPWKTLTHSLTSFNLTPESGGDKPIPNFVNVNGQMSKTLFVMVD
jgi:hypothetical protein